MQTRFDPIRAGAVVEDDPLGEREILFGLFGVLKAKTGLGEDEVWLHHFYAQIAEDLFGELEGLDRA
jgi:hypothetical protein